MIVILLDRSHSHKVVQLLVATIVEQAGSLLHKPRYLICWASDRWHFSMLRLSHAWRRYENCSKKLAFIPLPTANHPPLDFHDRWGCRVVGSGTEPKMLQPQVATLLEQGCWALLQSAASGPLTLARIIHDPALTRRVRAWSEGNLAHASGWVWRIPRHFSWAMNNPG